MRLVIDGRPLVGNRTGIGVHTAEIAGRLHEPPLIASHAVIENRQGLEHCAFRVDHSPYGVLWQGRNSVTRRLGPTTPVPGVYAAGAHATPGAGLPSVGLSAALVAQSIGPA